MVQASFACVDPAPVTGKVVTVVPPVAGAAFVVPPLAC